MSRTEVSIKEEYSRQREQCMQRSGGWEERDLFWAHHQVSLAEAEAGPRRGQVGKALDIGLGQGAGVGLYPKVLGEKGL